MGDENARSGYQEIIDTYREAKQWPQATAAAKEAVQKLPDDRDLRMVLDAQLADTGEVDKSVADIRTMLKGGPEDREVYLRLGIIYTRAKRWNEAWKLSPKRSNFRPSPKTKPTSLSCAAICTSAQKMFDQAEAEFRKVLATTRPTDPQAPRR